MPGTCTHTTCACASAHQHCPTTTVHPACLAASMVLSWCLIWSPATTVPPSARLAPSLPATALVVLVHSCTTTTVSANALITSMPILTSPACPVPQPLPNAMYSHWATLSSPSPTMGSSMACLLSIGRSIWTWPESSKSLISPSTGCRHRSIPGQVRGSMPPPTISALGQPLPSMKWLFPSCS